MEESIQHQFVTNCFVFINCDNNSRSIIDRSLSIRNYCLRLELHYREEFCESRNSFKDLLDALIEECRVESLYPMLHIEVHGNDNGLGFADNSRMDYLELNELLSGINFNCRNNLVLVLAACRGINVASVFPEYLAGDNHNRAPVFMAIAPVEDVSYDYLDSKLETFYDLLLSNSKNNTYDAFECLKLSQSDGYEEFMMYTTAQVFYLVSDNLIREDVETKIGSPENLESTIQSFIKGKFKNTGILPMEGDEEKLRQMFLTESTYYMHFNELRKRYFMIDVYPENASRFPEINKVPNWNKYISIHLDSA